MLVQSSNLQFINAATILNTVQVNYFGKVLFIIQFFGKKKTLTFQKMVVHGHSVITQGKVILALIGLLGVWG